MVAALTGLGGLGSDNSPEVWFVRGSEAVERDRRIAETFDRRELVRLVLETPGEPSVEVLAWWAATEERAAEIPGVAGVVGPRSRTGEAWPPSDPAAFLGAARRSSLARGIGWVADEPGVLTTLVELEPGVESTRVLGSLEDLLVAPPDGATASVVGLPVLNRALDRSAAEITHRFAPALVLLASLLVLLVLRSFRALLVGFAVVGVTEAVTIGAMGWRGVEWNLVLAVLPPVLFVISLATVLHLLLTYRSLRREHEPAEAARATWREKGWSVYGTGATTLAGFLALATSPVGPVRDLGLWIAAGVLVLMAAARGLAPLLLARLDPGTTGPGRFERWAEGRGRAWGGWAVGHSRSILVGAGLLALVAAAGVPRLKVESNALRYLAPEHPARKGIEELEARGLGIATVEIVARSEGPWTPEDLARLEGLGESFDGPVLHRLDVSTLLAEARARVPFDPGPGVLLRAVESRPEARRLLAGLWNRDERAVRIVLFVETGSAELLLPAIDRWTASVAAELPAAEVEAGGRFPLLLETQRYLLRTLLVSLGLTLVIVAVLLRVLLPSSRLALRALVPNLWPVLGVLGWMGWAGVPLDVATVMVASVALGLAIDDTLHTLGRFRRWAPRQGARRAVVTTLERTAGAYLLTAAVLAAGFGVCGLSDFAPTRRFGLLSATAILLALVGDLLLLPALLAPLPEEVTRRFARRGAGPEARESRAPGGPASGSRSDPPPRSRR